MLLEKCFMYYILLKSFLFKNKFIFDVLEKIREN